MKNDAYATPEYFAPISDLKSQKDALMHGMTLSVQTNNSTDTKMNNIFY